MTVCIAIFTRLHSMNIKLSFKRKQIQSRYRIRKRNIVMPLLRPMLAFCYAQVTKK